MNEQITKPEEQLDKANAVDVGENKSSTVTAQETVTGTDVSIATKFNLTKKKNTIVAIATALIVAIIAIIIFVPSEFERVRSECVQIAGKVTGSGDYFMIDTMPDEYATMDDRAVALVRSTVEEKALDAIKYANEELGFNGSVYSQMIRTTALMGRQSAENDDYRVTWTYHPNDGLEVTYEKK